MFALLDGAHLSQCPADCLTWLVDASVKATVVLALAYVASIVLRRADASIRRALWTAALLGVLFMPVLSYVTPSWRLALLPALRVTPDNIATFAAAPAETVGSPVSGKHQEVFPDRSQPPGVIAGPLRKTRKSAMGVLLESLVRTPWGTAAALPVLGVWLIGVMVVLGRLAAGLKRTIRYTRTATPLIDEAWRSQIVQLTAQMRCTRKITLLGNQK